MRIDRAHHRPVAGGSGEVEGLKLVARTHQSLIWDRTRHLQRLRQVLREDYPGTGVPVPTTSVLGAAHALLVVGYDG